MPERRRVTVYVLLFSMITISYIDRVVLSIAAPVIAKEFGFGPVQIGYLLSSFIWTYLVFLIPTGIAADRWGGRAVGSLAMAIWSISCMLTGAVGTYAGIFACRLMLGAAEAASAPVGGRVIRNWAPKAERGFAASCMISGTYAGLAFGSFFIGWLITSFGWRGSFFITGGIGVLGAVVWYAIYNLPEQAWWLSSDERGHILKEREATDAAANPATIRPLSALRALLTSRSMLTLFVAQGCAGYSLYLFLSWMPSYLATSRGLDITRMGFLSSIPYAVTAVLVILFSNFIDRCASASQNRIMVRKCAIVASMIVSSVILVTPFVDSIWLLLALFSLSFSCVATTLAMNLALVNDLLRNSNYAGMATSILITGGNSFGILAPIVTGYLVAGSGGFAAAFLIAGVLQLCGAVCILLAGSPIDVAIPTRVAAEHRVA
jgi:MFS family permease